jgi:hypothetical protein
MLKDSKKQFGHLSHESIRPLDIEETKVKMKLNTCKFLEVKILQYSKKSTQLTIL